MMYIGCCFAGVPNSLLH